MVNDLNSEKLGHLNRILTMESNFREILGEQSLTPNAPNQMKLFCTLFTLIRIIQLNIPKQILNNPHGVNRLASLLAIPASAARKTSSEP